MIIIQCNEPYFLENKIIQTISNCFINSTEFVDNEINEALVKEINFTTTYYYNMKGVFHNPIGPAILYFDENNFCYWKEYWINGFQFSKEEFEEKIKNDYRKL